MGAELLRKCGFVFRIVLLDSIYMIARVLMVHADIDRLPISVLLAL